MGGVLFAHPANYVLKIIQAAVSSQPDEIFVNARGDTLQVTWHPNLLDSNLDLLENTLKELPGPQPSRFLRHLALGMRAAAAQDARRVVWAQRDINGAEALILDISDQAEQSSRISRLPLAGKTSVRPEYVFQIQRSQPSRSWLRWLVSEAAFPEESQRLVECCHFCPIPIYLNQGIVSCPRIPPLSEGGGFQIGRGFFYDVLVERLLLSRDPLLKLLSAPPLATRLAASYDFGWGVQDLRLGRGIALYEWRSFTNKTALLEEPQGGASRHLFVPQVKPSHRAQFGSFTWNLIKRPGEIPLTVPGMYHVTDFAGWTRPTYGIPRSLLPALQPLAGQAYLVAPCRAATALSQLFVMQDGVLLAPMNVELALPGMLVILADEALKTDLSGLQPQDDARLQATLVWLREESESMKKSARRTVRFGEKLSMNPGQLKELRQRLQVEDLDY